MYGNVKERTSITPEKRAVLLLLAAGADNDSRDQYLYSSNVSCSDVYACRQNCMAETCCLDMAYVSGSTVGICMDIRKIYHSKGGRKR